MRVVSQVLVFVLGVGGLGSGVIRAQKRTAQSPSPPAYRVIVHPSHPISVVSRNFLADAFLKKRTRWKHGDMIRPVDQDSKSYVRRQFTHQVLKRSVPAVKSYWQQLIFSGRGIPPPELDNDQAVVNYVLKHPGAMGYVSGHTHTKHAKILDVR